MKRLLTLLMVLLLAACSGGDGNDAPSQPDQGGESILSLQVTPVQGRIPVGLEQQFIALATMLDGSVRDVTDAANHHWSSSDGSVAAITATGLATGITPGSVTITASGTANGTAFSATAALTVTSAVVTALQVTPATASIPVGLEQAFVATAFLSDGSALEITDHAALSWSSSDPAIATIDSSSKKGLATGRAAGSVTITASGTANGTAFSATAALTVTSAVVTALQVTPATASIPVGLEQAFVATAFLSDGSALEVTDHAALSWSSSAPTIATIDSSSKKGLATGRAAGSVTITASGTANGTAFSATAALTVTSAVVTALQVTPATASIPVGLEQAFVATAFLSDGSALEVTDHAALSWSSSAPAIATIDSSSNNKGLATGRAAGSVTITASGTANGTAFSATAALTVTGAVVTALQVTPATASIPVGLEQAFVATAFLSDGSALEVTDHAALSWSSSDPAIATIDSSSKKGLATGRAAGSVTITASGTANGTAFSATAALTVTSAVVTALQVTPATASIPVGLEQAFVATAFLSDGSALEVTDHAALSWSSSAPAIATIDSSSNNKGLATGRAAGSVTITASGTANGTAFSATAALTVTGAVVTALQVTPATASIPVGLEQAFVATAFLSDGSALEVTDHAALSWSSSDPAIATIDSSSKKGLATGRAAGSVTITASGTANGTAFSATAALTVTGAVVTALQVTPATASIPVGLEQAFVATAFLSDGSALEVTDHAALSWSSSDPAIATIDSGSKKGLATGRAAGSVTITASGTANGTAFSATAALTVTGAVVTALQVTPATASIPVGSEQAFVATATLSDGSALEVTDHAALSWSSSDPAIATIDSGSDKGLATGSAVGSVTITASGTANGTAFSATAALTVTACTIGTLTHRGLTFSLTFICTPTITEADADGIKDSVEWVEPIEDVDHVFALMDWVEAETYCNNLGNGYRLPTNQELRDLYFRFGPLDTYAGWPSNFWYWTSTKTGDNHFAVNITNGDSDDEVRADTSDLYVSCVQSGF